MGYLMGLGSISRVSRDQKTSMERYESSSTIYAAVSKRAEKVGAIEFQLFKRKPNGELGDQIQSNPYLNVLYRPNQYQTKNEFFGMYQTFKDLAGAAFIYVMRNSDGTPFELHLLRPDLVKFERNQETGLIEEFEYSPTGDPQKTVKLPAEDVIFSITPNPLGFIKMTPMSPLVPGSVSADTEEQLTIYQNRVLKNGGKVEGILKTEQEGLTKEQRDELREQFAEQHAGADKSGKPLLLSGGIEYDNIGLTPTELSFIESRKMTRDDILMLYGVPKEILALSNDVNYATIEGMIRIFLSETIEPLHKNLDQKLNEFFIPDEYELKHVNAAPEDQEKKIARVESGLNNNWMTINEARIEMGLDPIEGGEVLLVNMSKVPLSFVTDESPPPSDPAAKSLKVKKKREGERLKKDNGAAFKHPLRNDAVRDAYRKNSLKNQLKNERMFRRKVREYFKGQERRVIEYIEARPKNIINDAFDMTLEISIARDILGPLLEEFAKQAGKDIVNLFDQPLEFIYSDRIRRSIEARRDMFTKEINDTTFDALQQAFQDSIAANEGPRQLINRIQKVYGDADKVRATTIARTEPHIAVQEGVFEGYKQMNIPTKVWVAVGDDATRPSHLAADGEEVPLDAQFSNGLRFPGDPTGPASEVVNCRCSI